MPERVIVTVGTDMTNPGKFYWNIKDIGMDTICVRKGFDTLEQAKADFEQFRRDLAGARIVENLAAR